MAKKRYSKSEKEKRLKKALTVGAIVFAAVAVTAIVLGVVLGNVRQGGDPTGTPDENGTLSGGLREALGQDYLADPWDEGTDPAGSFEKKEGALWALFEALMCVEDDGKRNGSEGVVFPAGCDTLCVDLSSIADPALRRGAEYFFQDYCRRKNMDFRTGTLETLKKEGLIDQTSGSYDGGCLLTVGLSDEKTGDDYSVDFFFYFSSLYGRGATVRALRGERFDEFMEERGKEGFAVSSDGVWNCFIEQTIVS